MGAERAVRDGKPVGVAAVGYPERIARVRATLGEGKAQGFSRAESARLSTLPFGRKGKVSSTSHVFGTL